MKTTIENKYICEECEKPCSQVYGDAVGNKYLFRCVKCAFKSKKLSTKR